MISRSSPHSPGSPLTPHSGPPTPIHCTGAAPQLLLSPCHQEHVPCAVGEQWALGQRGEGKGVIRKRRIAVVGSPAPSSSWGDLSHKDTGLLLSPLDDICEQRSLISPDLLVTISPSVNMEQRYPTPRQGKGPQSLCVPTEESPPWPTSIYSSFGFKTSRVRHNWLLPMKLYAFYIFRSVFLGVTFWI